MPTYDMKTQGFWFTWEEVMGKRDRLLCFVLLSADRRCWWQGPGFSPVRDRLPRAQWPSRAEARRAARALKAASNIDAVPTPVYLV